jgi:biotin carboxylase
VAGTVLIVGYFPPIVAAADKFLPPRSVVVVEEPDLIEVRHATAQLADAVAVRELREWEFQRPGAADRFYQRHRDERVVAVVPATEYAVPFAARLAERCGVPGASYGAAEILRDKFLLRAVTTEAGIANPPSVEVSGPDDVRLFAAGQNGGTVIIKPANRQGSIGTWIVEDITRIDDAWTAAMLQDEPANLPGRGMPLRMLAERHINGTEYSVEMLVQEGVNRFANVTGKLLFPGPRPIERGHVVPADIPPVLYDTLVTQTSLVVGAVGFATGVVHCEWIVTTDGTPYLVECAGRLPGDWIVNLIEHAWPIDLANRYFAVMRGEQPKPPPVEPASVSAVWFLEVEEGVVASIEGVAQARAVPDIVAAECFVAVGDRTRALRSSADRVAMAMSWAGTHVEAWEAATTAISKIRLTVRPNL